MLPRGPGEASKSDTQAPENCVSSRTNRKCKGPEANCFLPVFLLRVQLVLSETEITMMRPSACVQPTEFNRFPLVQRYKLPHQEERPRMNLWPVTSCTKVPTNRCLSGCSAASDTCPDVVSLGKTTHTWVGHAHSPSSPNLSHCPHSWGQNLSKFHLQPPTQIYTLGIQREGETDWAAPWIPSLPPSTAFTTQGSERVPTSQEPTSPTLTSRSWHHVCQPATPRWAHCPLQTCPSSSLAFFTFQLPQAQHPFSLSRETQDAFRHSWIQMHLLFPGSPLLR